MLLHAYKHTLASMKANISHNLNHILPYINTASYNLWAVRAWDFGIAVCVLCGW